MKQYVNTAMNRYMKKKKKNSEENKGKWKGKNTANT